MCSDRPRPPFDGRLSSTTSRTTTSKRFRNSQRSKRTGRSSTALSVTCRRPEVASTFRHSLSAKLTRTRTTFPLTRRNSFRRNAYWNRYVQVRWLPRGFVIPVFLFIFLVILYFAGRLFTFGLGRWFFRQFDAAILRIPIVNKVYGSVKQVTDFAFNEREIEFNNVVLIEYPRKGIWSMGFATGSSIPQIAEVTGEEMLSVLMPTSPMPMTGFTVTVKRSEAIDLDMSVDEAIQFVVSCGVVIPPQRRKDDSSGKLSAANPSQGVPALATE